MKMVRNSSTMAALVAVLIGTVSLPVHAKTDFNVVGREMAGMLQNSHYARIQFNADLSAKILTDYLAERYAVQESECLPAFHLYSRNARGVAHRKARQLRVHPDEVSGYHRSLPQSRGGG